MFIYDKGVALVMEVTKSCAMSCIGCKINKNLSTVPDSNKLEQLHEACSNLKTAGVSLVEYELGPTDLISASNRDEIFENVQLRATASMFEVLAINASFSYVDDGKYAELAKKVSEFCDAPSIALQIPVNMKHMANDKYFALIKENIRAFKEASEKPVVETIFTVIVDELLVKSELESGDFKNVYERCRQLRGEGYGFDFLSHHGLEPLIDRQKRDDFIKTLKKFNKGFAEFIEDAEKEYDRRYGSLKDFGETAELVYNEGKLYMRPTIREKSNLFHDKLEITDITDTGIVGAVFSLYNTSIALSETYSDCSECTRRLDCSAKLVPVVMDIVDTTDCLIGLKEI